MKIVIIQPYNTPYRNELFNKISRFKDVELYLVYISKRSLDRQWTDELIAEFKEIQIKCSITHLSYEKSRVDVSYFDLIYQMYRINPDVIISTLSKFTILLKYAFFWKNVRLIHWSEETLITSKGEKRYQKHYQFFHRNYPTAYIFPGKLAYEFHKICGLNVTNENTFFGSNSVDACYSLTDDELEKKFDESNVKRILYVGSYIKLKSFDNLMIAFDSISKHYSSIEFHVAGGGPITPSSKVINHGFVSKEEVVDLYKSCHVFIMPSLWDCNPLSVIEAAKCGCVLLLSDGVGNYPELVDGNGSVFVRGEVASLVEAIEFVMSKSMQELKGMAIKSIELSKKNNHTDTADVFYNAIRYAVSK